MSPSVTADVFAQALDADLDEDVLRALSARERRYVVYFLLDHDRVTVGELGDVLAGWTAVTEDRVATPLDRESLVTALYHNHLPKLDDVGLVEFDANEGVVRSLPLSDPVEDLVRATYLAEHRHGVSSEQ